MVRDPETGELRVKSWDDPNKNTYQVRVRICLHCNNEILNQKIEIPIEDELKDWK